MTSFDFRLVFDSPEQAEELGGMLEGCIDAEGLSYRRMPARGNVVDLVFTGNADGGGGDLFEMWTCLSDMGFVVEEDGSFWGLLMVQM